MQVSISSKPPPPPRGGHDLKGAKTLPLGLSLETLSNWDGIEEDDVASGKFVTGDPDLKR